MTDLKNCPFCGSDDINTEGPCYTQFMCNDCGASIYDQDSHEAAIAAWNLRAAVWVTDAEYAWGLLRSTAESVCRKLESETASVTILDQSALRAALDQVSCIEPLRPATEQAGGEVPFATAWQTNYTHPDWHFAREASFSPSDLERGIVRNVTPLYASPPSPAATQSAVVSDEMQGRVRIIEQSETMDGAYALTLAVDGQDTTVLVRFGGEE